MEYPKSFRNSNPVVGPMPDFPGRGGRGGDEFRDLLRGPFRDDDFRRWLRDQPFNPRWRRPERPKWPDVPYKPPKRSPVPKLPFGKFPWRFPFGNPFWDSFGWMFPDPFEWIPGGAYPGPGQHLSLSGFRFLRQCAVWKELTPPCSDAGSFALRRNDGNVVCFTNQAWSSTILAGDPVPANWGIVSGVNNTGPSSNRCLRNNEAIAFQRLVAGIIPAPSINPGPQWIPNPFEPGIPGPDPFWGDGSDPVESGPDPGDDPLGSPDDNPETVTDSGPGLDTTIDIGNPPPLKPPPAGQKERKFKITVRSTELGKVLSWAFGMVTEWSELVDCFWDALPDKIKAKHLRPRRLPDSSPFADEHWCVWDDKKGEWRCGVGNREPGIDVKMRILYQEFNHVRVGTALECIVANAIEDSAFGRLGKISTEAAIKQGRPITFEFGPAL